MKRLLTTTLIAFTLSFPAATNAQQESLHNQMITPDNAAYKEKIHFVFGADFFESQPELQEQFVRLLRDRVELRFEPPGEGEKFPLISSLPLMNKHNAAVQAHAPQGFSAEAFNPLIYGWDFFSDKVQVFRIDGTDYLLIVQPQ